MFDQVALACHTQLTVWLLCPLQGVLGSSVLGCCGDRMEYQVTLTRDPLNLLSSFPCNHIQVMANCEVQGSCVHLARVRSAALVRHFLPKQSQFVTPTGQIHNKRQKKGELFNVTISGRKTPPVYHWDPEERLRLK